MGLEDSVVATTAVRGTRPGAAYHAGDGSRAFATSLASILPRSDRRRSEHLDVVRAVAALAVVVGHVRGLFFVPWERVHDHTVIARAFYLLTGFGHQAVMVFFVLSGFLISLGVLASTAGGRWSWGWYLGRRLTRLLVVLAPALVLGAVFDFVGVRAFPNSIYSGIPSTVVGYSVASRLSATTFISNLCFLQNVVTPTYGSNGALWSLSCEFWYYVLFPLLVCTVVSSRIRTRCAYAAMFLALLPALGLGMSLYFLVWLLGTAIVVLMSKAGPLPWPRRFKYGAAAGLALALLASRVALPTGFVADAIIAFFFAAYLYGYLAGRSAAPGETGATRASRPLVSLAGFSYTLYVLHLPPLVLVSAIVFGRATALWQPDTIHLLIAAALAVAAVGFAFLVSRVTEARTEAIRAFLGRAVSQRMVRSATHS